MERALKFKNLLEYIFIRETKTSRQSTKFFFYSFSIFATLGKCSADMKFLSFFYSKNSIISSARVLKKSIKFGSNNGFKILKSFRIYFYRRILDFKTRFKEIFIFYLFSIFKNFEKSTYMEFLCSLKSKNSIYSSVGI